MAALQSGMKHAVMEPELSYWSSSHFRRVMLTEIGEAIKDYYAVSREPLPTNVLELLRRLDDDASQNRSGGGSPSLNTK
jgi:hypothetical protein